MEREHAVIPTVPCQNCGRELKLIAQGEGIVTSESCPTCYPRPETAAAERPLPREKGVPMDKAPEVVGDAE